MTNSDTFEIFDYISIGTALVDDSISDCYMSSYSFYHKNTKTIFTRLKTSLGVECIATLFELLLSLPNLLLDCTYKSKWKKFWKFRLSLFLFTNFLLFSLFLYSLVQTGTILNFIPFYKWRGWASMIWERER